MQHGARTSKDRVDGMLPLLGTKVAPLQEQRSRPQRDFCRGPLCAADKAASKFCYTKKPRVALDGPQVVGCEGRRLTHINARVKDLHWAGQ